MSHIFALLSVDELRQRQGVLAPQFESVKHSSYEHPPCETRPSQGKQRPFTPSVHWESEEQLEHGVSTQDGPGPRCEGQDADVLRCWRGTLPLPFPPEPMPPLLGVPPVALAPPDARHGPQRPAEGLRH